jgi:hypothetical protein
LDLIPDEDCPPPIEGNYSEELKQVVYRMLDKDQYERILIDELFQNPIFTPIKGEEKPFEFWLMCCKYAVGVPKI